MLNPEIYDVLVVGRGLLGSAAARHLALENLKVALVGPTEAENLKSKKVFASHYDDTRVQRIIAQNELWTRLNLDSARSWKSLQDSTGIDFYEPNGCIYLNNFQDDYLQKAPSLATEFGLQFKSIGSAEDLRSISPEINFEHDIYGIFEPDLAGLINPRKLVSAQLQSFVESGGQEINEVVTRIDKSKGLWKVKTSIGGEYSAEKVLIAAGAFTNFKNLLPRKLDFQNKSEVVILTQLSETDYGRLKNMPSLLYEIKTDEFDGIYLTAPTMDQSGNYVMKMGLNQKIDSDLNNQTDMNDWFARDSYEPFSRVLEREIRKLFPNILPIRTSLKPCVISRTKTENPYIGEAEEGLFVLHGCNGYSAMSSDAQGRQTAALIAKGKFDDGYSESDFELVYK
jgi:glycine/D-amino acid oxidase-like deaminating enzyme